MKNNNRRSRAEVRIYSNSNKASIAFFSKLLSCKIAADTYSLISVLVQLASARPRTRHGGHCILLDVSSVLWCRIQVWTERSPYPPSEHATANTTQWPLSSVRRVFGERMFVNVEHLMQVYCSIIRALDWYRTKPYFGTILFSVIAFFNKMFHSVILIRS